MWDPYIDTKKTPVYRIPDPKNIPLNQGVVDLDRSSSVTYRRSMYPWNFEDNNPDSFQQHVRIKFSYQKVHLPLIILIHSKTVPDRSFSISLFFLQTIIFSQKFDNFIFLLLKKFKFGRGKYSERAP